MVGDGGGWNIRIKQSSVVFSFWIAILIVVGKRIEPNRLNQIRE